MHPLIGKLDDLSIDEVIAKITELHKKLGQSIRFGNAQMANQIRAALATYQEEYQKRMAAESEKAKNHKMLKDKVQVSK